MGVGVQEVNTIRRIAEIMRRGSEAGQSRWRVRQLRARTGLSFSAVYSALKTLASEGVVEKDGVEWRWLKSK